MNYFSSFYLHINLGCYSCTKPSVHRTKGTLYFVAYLTYSAIDPLLSFGNLMSSCSLMHDAAFESHTFEGFLILGRVVSFIRIDKCLSW